MGKRFLFGLVVLISLGFSGNPAMYTRWVISPGSSLKVAGKTNVNSFTCVIANYSRPDTIDIIPSNSMPVYLNGNIRLDVQSFDCHNPVMTADLRKTLKTKQYPHLIIRFLSINKPPFHDTRSEITKGIVVIELAGISRKFDVDYKIMSMGNHTMNLVGTRKINFSDFNIEPPRKLGGMIRTENELNVEFMLKIKLFT